MAMENGSRYLTGSKIGDELWGIMCLIMALGIVIHYGMGFLVGAYTWPVGWLEAIGFEAMWVAGAACLIWILLGEFGFIDIKEGNHERGTPV